MNILLINHYAGSVQHGMEYRAYYLAREWARSGHHVTIAAASRSHLRLQNPAVCGAIAEEQIDGIRYLWLKTPPYRGNSAGRAWNILRFTAQLRTQAGRLADPPPDVVIASSTYPLDNYAAHRIARRHGAVHVFEVHDLWPLTPIELGGMSPRHPWIRLLQRAEDFACRNADRVVSILPCTRAHLEARGMAPEKWTHVPNGIDPEEWSAEPAPLPEEHDRALSRLRAEGRFLVGYAGGHSVSNALESFIDSAPFLQSDPVSLVLVGQGPDKDALMERARALCAANTLFLPPVPKAAIPGLLARMDALYVGMRRSPLYRFGVSLNKMMDYMMSARPIIQGIEAANDMAAEAGCGLSIPPEDPEAIASAVRTLLAMPPHAREAMGARGREHVIRYHDYRALARQFLQAVGYSA